MDFSVIIPTRNRTSLLEICLHSLLNQQFNGSFEIIVVDDGSSPSVKQTISSSLLKNRKITLLRQPYKGIGAARNAGLRKAKGTYVAFTDDDCEVPTHWLSTLAKELTREKFVGVGGSVVNTTDKYIAWTHHLLNFSNWFEKQHKQMCRDLATANAAYVRSELPRNPFPCFYDAYYEDTLMNFGLLEKGRKLVFLPSLFVKHHTWRHNYGLSKFFASQRRAARGFVFGGYRTHALQGKVLMTLSPLNFLCPRLLYVGWRSLRYGYFKRFLYCFPLLVVGEWYRAWIILLTRKSPDSIRQRMN